MEGLAKKEIIKQLQEKILVLEGFKKGITDRDGPDFGLQAMESAFPYPVFPTGVIHEFISPTAACATASNAFISGLLSTLMKNGEPCLWISTKRSLYPPALKLFGIEPHRVIFVDVTRDKDALWVMEQGLKCNALAAVVTELSEISFAESQRLQLVVERSQVTGFLHRKHPRRENTLACITRWKIKPVASYVPHNLPGVGYPVWEVHLEKIRNGKPGKWQWGWWGNQFVHISPKKLSKSIIPESERYA